MLNTQTRAMTDEERGLIEEIVQHETPPEYSQELGVGGVAFLVLLSAVAVAVTYWLFGMVAAGILAALCLIGVVAALVSACFGRRADKREKLQYQQALDDGHAEVLHCQADVVAAVEEFEDEGAAWYFDVGDGTILFVGGQDYYESGEFPNDDFEVVRTAYGEFMLRLHSSSTARSASFIDRTDFSYMAYLGHEIATYYL